MKNLLDVPVTSIAAKSAMSEEGNLITRSTTRLQARASPDFSHVKGEAAIAQFGFDSRARYSSRFRDGFLMMKT